MGATSPIRRGVTSPLGCGDMEIVATVASVLATGFGLGLFLHRELADIRECLARLEGSVQSLIQLNPHVSGTSHAHQPQVAIKDPG